jgi:Xaa-Pro aminopeptidase
VERLKNLRKKLPLDNLDGMLIGSPANRRYLSNFTGSAGWLIISVKKAYLAVDFRYVEQAGRESTAFEVYPFRGDIGAWLPTLLQEMGVRRLGVESDHLPVSTYQSLTRNLQKTDIQMQVVCEKNTVEALRMVKDHNELQHMESACKLADAAMLHARRILRAGISEKQVAWELESFMRQNGSQPLPFDIIVASGQNAALPHAQPMDKLISEGEPVVIDLGARYQGYCSDITRTFIIDKSNDVFHKIYNIVLGAQLTGLSIIEAGMNAGVADGLVRGIIDNAGYGEQFGHGLGHGVGLEMHEAPRLGTLSEDTLQENMVFTIEPGIYIPGWGGIRIEDTVVIRDGKLNTLTHAGKEALVDGGNRP